MVEVLNKPQLKVTPLAHGMHLAKSILLRIPFGHLRILNMMIMIMQVIGDLGYIHINQSSLTHLSLMNITLIHIHLPRKNMLLYMN